MVEYVGWVLFQANEINLHVDPLLIKDVADVKRNAYDDNADLEVDGVLFDDLRVAFEIFKRAGGWNTED